MIWIGKTIDFATTTDHIETTIVEIDNFVDFVLNLGINCIYTVGNRFP